MNEKLIGLTEAGKILGVQLRQVQYLIDTGKLAAEKIPPHGFRAVRAEDVRALKRKREEAKRG